MKPSTVGHKKHARDETASERRLRELETECASLRARLGGSDEIQHCAPARNSAPRGARCQPSPAAGEFYREIAEILDSSADAIMTVNGDGIVQRFNRGAESIFGWRASEIIGRPIDVLIPERFRRNHRHHFKGFKDGAETSRLMNSRGEISGLRADGSEFPAEASITKRTVGGRAQCTMILRDISKRKEAEEKLREREAELRRAHRMARMGTFAWDDVTDTCISCSREFAEIFGMAPEAFIEQRGTREKFLEHLHPDDRYSFDRVMQDAVARASAYDIEYRCYDSAGQLKYVREIGEPVLDGSGRQIRTFATAQDVTRMRQAEEARRASEAQFRSLIENSIQGVLIHDYFRPVFANQALADIFGYDSAEEIVALDVIEPLLAPAERSRLLGLNEARRRGEQVPSRYEFQGLRADGSPIWLEISASVTEWNGEQTVLSTIVDISDRKRAELRLRRSAQASRALENIATAANEASSPEDAIAVCLREIAEYGDWSVAHIFEQAVDGSPELVPSGVWYLKDSKQFRALQEVTARSRFMPGVGLPGRVFRDAEPLWIADISSDGNFPRVRQCKGLGVTAGFGMPVLIGHEVVAVLEFFSPDRREPDGDMLDMAARAGTILGRVYERQRAGQALRDSEEQMRLLTDNIPALIAYVGTDKRLRFVNRTCERWYGRPAAELVGHHLSEFFSEESFSRMDRRLDAALAGEALHFVEELKYGDGTTRNIDVAYVPHFGPDATLRGIFALVIDVSDRIRAEEQLRQAQRMEAVGKLTGGVAHDFNNLLAVIQGSIEVLKDKVGKGDPVIEAASRASRRGAELTQRLLSFSRQQPLRPTAVDMRAMLQGMSGMLRRALGETIRIDTEIQPGIWAANADVGQLETAVLNLAVNSQHAMPRGGTLRISAENVKLSRRQAASIEGGRAGPFVRVTVADTGCGMSAEVAARAFEPFFTTKGVGEGSGLGLSMVYGFASQSDGFVQLESREGQGTSIQLYLPRTVATKTRKPARSPQPSSHSGAGGTILVVEDDPDVRRLTVTMLKSLGHTVLEAEDSDGAISLLEENRQIDLMLSDVVLPGESGPAIARAARKLRPEISVLFMSGYAEDVIRQDGSSEVPEIGAELLNKPFTRADLADKVQAALELARHIHA